MLSKYTLLILAGLSLIGFVGCGGSEKPDADGANNAGAVSTKPNETDARESASDTERNGSEVSGNSAASSEGSSTDSAASTGSANRSGATAGDGSGSTSKGNFGGALFPSSAPTNSVASNVGRSTGSFSGNSPAGSDSDPFDLGDDFHSSSGSGSASKNNEGSGNRTESASISLLVEAKRLFEQQNEQAAVDYVYANHLVSTESRNKYSLDWYPGLKEPRLFFRWGVGIVFRKSGDVKGRHPVIGDPGDENENSSGGRGNRSGRNSTSGRGRVGAGASSGGGSRSGRRTYKNVDTNRPDGFLLYYTGEFGESLIDFLDSRRKDQASPYYGAILRDVLEAEGAKRDDETANESDTSNRTAQNGGGLATGTAGLTGDSQSRGNSRRRNNRRTQRSTSRTDSSVLDRATGNSTAIPPDDEFTGTIVPGVELLGVGSKNAIFERAAAANVDALILFSVNVKKTKSRNRRTPETTTNTTSMKIFDLKQAPPKSLFSTKALKDTDVSEKVADGEDPVGEQIERAFQTLADESFRAAEMPAGLNQDNVKKRIGSLLKTPGDVLRAAVEIVSFYESDLLSADLAKTALSRLFKDETAAVLVDGTPIERLNFLRDKLPEGPGE